MNDSAAPTAVQDLLARDARHCWHPYTQHGIVEQVLPVVRAQGATLTLADGRELVDGISSWWATLHGHGHPRLVEAIARQAAELDHVLFAGATHEPAVRLAELLVERAPGDLNRVFYSDDGSTAVEVALKMALQAWVQRGQPERRVFVALEGAYHGDTFGAMAVGDPDPFFRAYESLLFEVRRVPARGEAAAAALEELGGRAAGLIVEPLVQGAAGMWMHSEEELRGMRAACDAAGVPFIADEVMTGFGRTGRLFACERAGVAPDMLCLGKGITAGMLPLAATLATEPWYESFLSTDRSHAFFHGHTFTANPTVCALAVESIAVGEDERTPERLDAVGARIEAGLAERAASDPTIRELRRTGGIVALELEAGDAGYLASLGPRLRKATWDRGALLRPLGNVLYALPPACTTEEQADTIVSAMLGALDELND